MEYIDKHNYLEEGNSYSLDYLCDSFDEEEQNFKPSIKSKQAYKDFSNKKYRYGEGLGERKGIEPLLVKEQNNHCCYCMGRIESRKVTIEHIIPESFTDLNEQDEFEFYTKQASVLAENVELASQFATRKFVSKEEVCKVEKFPHLIAYVNLTASCRGLIGEKGKSCFCNTPRGNTRIIPLMLKSDTPNSVRYTEQGLFIIVGYDKKEMDNTIAALGLNHETLKQVRELWYRASRTNITVEDIQRITTIQAKMALITTLFNVENYTLVEKQWQTYAPTPKYDKSKTKEEIENTPTPYWDLFSKYDWFYDYYKKHYPNNNLNSI
ncbi:HNH endonuclease [Bacteroides sp.]